MGNAINMLIISELGWLANREDFGGMVMDQVDQHCQLTHEIGNAWEVKKVATKW
jgi:hypothetical protein